MFEGLTSRCTNPILCAAWSAEAIHVVPRSNWLTIKVGIGAALLGTALARAMGIPTATSGVDWLELLVQSSTRQLVSLWWPPPSDDGDPECCGVA
jgi:hypothetical protein